jgi:hypothetical protein
VPGRRAFYLHNPSGDIGHAVHLLRLLAALKARGGRNLIFLRAPSVYPHGLLKDYGEVKTLPARPTAASGLALCAALKKFRPALLVTEFFPFGRAECLPEALPLIRAARACGAAVAASAPMPYFTAPAAGLPGLLDICALYDRLLIHSPEGADLPYMARASALERRVSPAAFLSFFEALKEKVVFTGYLLERRPPVASKNFVLVTRGGGSTSDRLLEAAIGAAPLIGRPLLVIAGPSTTPARLAHFRRLAAGCGGDAAVLLGFTDMPRLMAQAAACVSTAGGSVYELLALKKKMVLAPYCGTRGREHSDQLARAWLARDLAGAELLLPGELTPEKVAAAVLRRLARPLKISAAVKPAWFRGAERSAAGLEALCR